MTDRLAAMDSPRWCADCSAYGDHHTDRHPKVTRREWFITTPYIDAYETPGVWGSPEGAIDFDKFKSMMASQASQWGEQSVGHQVMFRKPPAVLGEGRYVLAMGWWGTDHFVYVDGGVEPIDKYPSEWDVT